MAINAKKADAHKREEFTQRLDTACDNHPHVPDKFKGRQIWIRQELGKRGVKISAETVSRWFTAEAKPRPTTMNLLAEILGVDVAWLALGSTPNVPSRERRLRNAMADGVVNLVAGMIALDGGVPAFPQDREGSAVDLYAIVKGANYSIHVVPGEHLRGDTYRFTVTGDAEPLFKMGVVRLDAFHFRLFELPSEMFSTDGNWAGPASIEVTPEDMAEYEITSFSERF